MLIHFFSKVTLGENAVDSKELMEKVFSTVEVITGYVTIEDYPWSDVGFFRNLKAILGSE